MPLNNPFYTAEIHGDFELHSIGRFELEEGGVIPNLELAVATYGTLNQDKSNAILIPTFFTGTHQLWQMAYIGPGRALDPDKYFIVVINQIGNGLSTSPHNTDDESIAMSKFPNVRIGDDVRAQEQLLREVFGIEELFAVVGASMGLDPNSLLAQAWKWQRGDVARNTGGDVKAALGRITAKVFILPIDEDMFFPPRDCAVEQAIIPGSELRVIKSIGGHFGLFGFEPSYFEQVESHLQELFAADV